MSRYELYKKASYDWLKNIPFHWEELFLEQVAQEKLKKIVIMILVKFFL